MNLNVNEYLLNYLVNGDDQGLSDNEIMLCDDILGEFESPLISLEPDSESFFHLCDITNIWGNCYEIVIISWGE